MSKPNEHALTTTRDAPPLRFQAAYELTAAARAALDKADLLPVNLDPRAVFTTVMRARSRFAALREEIVANFLKFDLARFDALETLAKALMYAHILCLAATEPAAALPSLVARGVELRGLLLLSVRTLVKRRLLDPRPLGELKGGRGYVNLAADLGVLARVIRRDWSNVAQWSATSLEELDEAEGLSERIVLAYAGRPKTAAVADAAAEERQRAYTLVLNAYDQARRAVAYLRWSEGDGETIAPSLWAGRGGRGAQGKEGVGEGETSAPEGGGGAGQAHLISAKSC